MDFVEKKKIAELSQSHAENAPTIVTDIFKTNDSKVFDEIRNSIDVFLTECIESK